MTGFGCGQLNSEWQQTLSSRRKARTQICPTVWEPNGFSAGCDKPLPLLRRPWVTPLPTPTSPTHNTAARCELTFGSLRINRSVASLWLFILWKRHVYCHKFQPVWPQSIKVKGWRSVLCSVSFYISYSSMTGVVQTPLAHYWSFGSGQRWLHNETLYPKNDCNLWLILLFSSSVSFMLLNLKLTPMCTENRRPGFVHLT